MGSSNWASIGVAVNMDKWTGAKKLKDLYRGDAVLHDNFLFKLHHQANFAIVLLGVAFIFYTNYLDGTAIKCQGKDPFQEQYCWLHGSGHIPKSLNPRNNIQCIAKQKGKKEEESFTENANQNQPHESDERHTRYYLWVPFILMLCLAIIKAPRVLWKEVCERGTTAGAVGRPNSQPADKIAERIRKLKRTGGTARFHFGFLVCELLNIAAVLTCFVILNALFGGKFHNYGSEFVTPTADVDPLCNLFPTTVSCNVRTGGSTGDVDNTNIICLLSNNLFNQYYFLIIWFWWVTLLSLSALGLVYRLAQVFVPGASQWVFLRRLEPHGITLKELGKLQKFSPADFFLLGRICQNLKGSQIVDVLKELNKGTSKAKGEVKETRVEREEEEEEEPEGNTERETMLTEVTTG